jgi:hypothetical protein
MGVFFRDQRPKCVVFHNGPSGVAGIPKDVLEQMLPVTAKRRARVRVYFASAKGEGPAFTAFGFNDATPLPAVAMHNTAKDKRFAMRPDVVFSEGNVDAFIGRYLKGSLPGQPGHGARREL